MKLIFEWRAATLFETDCEQKISPQIAALADEIISSTQNLTDSEIKTRAYLTAPMKRILIAEKAGRKMLNTPLLAHPQFPAPS